MKTNFTIDLEEGLRDKQSAKQVVAEVQKVIDDLVKSTAKMQEAAQEAINQSKQFQKDHDQNQELLVGFVKTIQTVHSVLGSKADLFKGDAQMKELMDMLAVFVSSSNVIKVGAMSNDK